MSRSFELRTYIAVFLALSSIVFLVGSIAGPPSAFIDLNGLVAALGLNLVLIAALFLLSAETRPIAITVAFAIMLFVQIRVAGFAILPSEAIGFLQVEPPTASEVARTLMLITFGTAALFAGAQAAAMVPAAKQIDRVRTNLQLRWIPPTFPVVGVLLLWTFCIVVGLIVISYISNLEPIPRHVGWLSRFFEADVALVITMVWLVVYRPASKIAFRIGLSLLVVWLFFSIFGGSRGGAVRILTVLVISVSLLGAAKISVRAFLVTIGLFLAVSVLTSAGGHVVRLANVTSTSIFSAPDDALAIMAHDVTRQDIYRKLPSLDENRKLPSSDEEESDSAFHEGMVRFTEALNPILLRMGNLDYAIVVLNREGNDEVLDKYVRSNYALKRIANSLVLGKIFENTELSTAQLFNVAYRGFSEEHAMASYLSEPWTIWGLAGVMFGPFGMIAALFVSGFLLQLGFLLMSCAPDPIRGVAQAMYLFLVVFGSVLMYGIDHTVIPLIHYAIATTSALIIVLAPGLVFRSKPMREGDPGARVAGEAPSRRD